MEPLWRLVYLLEPAPLTLILTATLVTCGSAFRALNYAKEMEKNRDMSEASITLDGSQALMIPLISSCSLLLMFYLFSSVSQILTAFTAVASVSALYFCFSPYLVHFKGRFGLSDPFVSRCCSKSFSKIQALLFVLCSCTVIAWLISGHWILNNLLGISLCIAFVSHVRLPNIKICAMLLMCLFVYDIFWVFYSERFFGANVMVSVATQQASNPIHKMADSLNLPGLQLITKKLELPVKIVFPRNLLGGIVPGTNASDFIMLGLGDMIVKCTLNLLSRHHNDISSFYKFEPHKQYSSLQRSKASNCKIEPPLNQAIPAMLLALVLCFDYRKGRDSLSSSDTQSSKKFKYIWVAVSGYFVGLIAALGTGILTHSPQPALLYLVPSTLGPIIILSWMRKELAELWEGSTLNIYDKAHVADV